MTGLTLPLQRNCPQNGTKPEVQNLGNRAELNIETIGTVLTALNK